MQYFGPDNRQGTRIKRCKQRGNRACFIHELPQGALLATIVVCVLLPNVMQFECVLQKEGINFNIHTPYLVPDSIISSADNTTFMFLMFTTFHLS